MDQEDKDKVVEKNDLVDVSDDNKSEFKYKLSYFNGRGLAEVSRIIFAIVDQDYEDYRYPLEVVDMSKFEFKREEFDKDKADGKLVKSLNKVPFLQVNDTILCQSKSIERFLGEKFELMGSSSIEKALVDSFCECIRDFKDLYQGVRKAENKEEALNKWFTETLKEKMELFENLLGNTLGYSVGEKLTLSDIVIYCFIKEFFDDKEGSLKSCENCPKILAVVKNVSDNPNLIKWLEKRPTTIF